MPTTLTQKHFDLLLATDTYELADAIAAMLSEGREVATYSAHRSFGDTCNIETYQTKREATKMRNRACPAAIRRQLQGRFDVTVDSGPYGAMIRISKATRGNR